MTSASSTFLNKLAQQLNVLSKKKLTGTLILSTTKEVGQIHIMGGRLIYAISTTHNRRRWERTTQAYCPKLKKDTSQLKDFHLWETQLLVHGLKKKEVSLKQAKLTLFNIVQEFFFDIAKYPQVKMQWKGGKPPTSKITLQLALSYEETKPSLLKAMRLYQQWQKAGLSKLNPNLAPFVQRKISPDAMSGLGKYLNGKFTLWDIALKSKKSVVIIAKSLIPLVQKKVLQFKNIPDLPTDVTKIKTTKKTAQKSYLIACIDDSPAVGSTMERILTPKGYKVINIEDPISGMKQLLKNKPDLIFLDVIMPNANGYSICQSLRKMAIFKNIPIIILSARETIKDREKAKKVGATNFLTKPPKAKEILAIVGKYL